MEVKDLLVQESTVLASKVTQHSQNESWPCQLDGRGQCCLPEAVSRLRQEPPPTQGLCGRQNIQTPLTPPSLPLTVTFHCPGPLNWCTWGLPLIVT